MLCKYYLIIFVIIIIINRNLLFNKCQTLLASLSCSDIVLNETVWFST